MIHIKKSPTADTRTCDVSHVSKEQLLNSSIQHIEDVGKGLLFFQDLINNAIKKHDYDKIYDIDTFYKDFKNDFKTTEWWDRHRKLNRHHLFVEDGVPNDVNLIDVLELIVDCVMAGLARTGYVYNLDLDPDVLKKAFENTIDLLKNNIEIKDND